MSDDQPCPQIEYGIIIGPQEISEIHGAVSRQIIDDIQDVANRYHTGYIDDAGSRNAYRIINDDIDRRHLEAWNAFLHSHGPHRD